MVSVHIKKSEAICPKFQKRKYCNSSSNIYFRRGMDMSQKKDLGKNPVPVSVLWQFTRQKIHK
jgi:hypothetical protein